MCVYRFCQRFFLYLSASFLPVLTQAQEWKSYDVSNSPIVAASEVRDITIDPVTNDVWITAGTSLHQKKKDGTWNTYAVGITDGLLASGCVGARNGQAWTGPRLEQSSQFTDKLNYFNGTSWQTITVPGAKMSYVSDIEISENRVWVAYDKGLLQYDGTAWTNLNFQNKFNQVTSLSWEAFTGKLWVSLNCAPNGNVFKYDVAQNTWTEYPLGPYKCVHAVQALPDGNAYVGSCNLSGLTDVANGQVSETLKSGCVSLDGTALNPLNVKETWFGTDVAEYEKQQGIPQGLILYDGSTIVKTFTSENSEMKGSSVYTLAVQQLDANTAVVWMKTYLLGAYFIEAYTYQAPGNSITSFRFLNPPVEASIEGNEIFAELPPRTDPSHLVATFTVSEGATVHVDDNIQTSGVTENDFAEPVIYSVTSLAGGVRNYRISLSIITGTEDNIRNQVQLFPVPATDHLTVRVPQNFAEKTPLKLTLYSILGTIQESREIMPGEETILNTSGLGHGVVILKINDQFFKVMVVAP
jgi:hypothetical protein